MTFEEFEKWADRMEERHEALAQSHEIFAHDIHELQAKLDALKIIVEEDHKSIVDLREAAFALLSVVQSHERRITDLEGNK
jgi:hypothetical protein